MNSFQKTNIFITLLIINGCLFAEDLKKETNNSSAEQNIPSIEKTAESQPIEPNTQKSLQPKKPLSANTKQPDVIELSIPSKRAIKETPKVIENEKYIEEDLRKEINHSSAEQNIPSIEKTAESQPIEPNTQKSLQPKKPLSANTKQPDVIELSTPSKQAIKETPKVIENEKYIEHEQIQKLPIKTEYNNNKEKGLAIITEVDRRDIGWQDSQATLKMILKNRQGDEHTRNLKMKTMEVEGDGDKSLSIFDSPKDIKGTAFLSFTHALVPDEQWLYLPAVKRVKRISSRNKSGPYLGSEFAFEDLSSFEVKKYSYEYLRDEVFDGIDCYVIEAYPEYKHSGYKRTMLWIDKQRYILLKTDYYDRKNSLLKTQTFLGFKQYLNQYWRPDAMEMVNHTNGKSTKLIWGNYEFRKGLTKRNFDKNTLKRAR